MIVTIAIRSRKIIPTTILSMIVINTTTNNNIDNDNDINNYSNKFRKCYFYCYPIGICNNELLRFTIRLKISSLQMLQWFHHCGCFRKTIYAAKDVNLFWGVGVGIDIKKENYKTSK